MADGRAQQIRYNVNKDMDKILELLAAEDSEIEDFSSEDEDHSVDTPMPIQEEAMSDEDCVPDDEISEPILTSTARNRANIWRRKCFEEKAHPASIDYSDAQIQLQQPMRPLEYFANYFPDEYFEEAAFFTNKYCLVQTGKQLNTNAVEIKKLYGAHIIIGNVPYPRVRMYWSDGFRLDMIASALSRDRFFQLRTCLHFVDTVAVSDDVKTNKLWKVQPVITAVQKRCRAIPRESKCFSIDEQMIPFAGHCPLKQYVKNKPTPVGLKNFVLTTSAGMVMDFEVYQGKSTPLPDSALGLGPSVVLRLVATLPKHSFVYFDRYFTTVGLMDRLLELNIEGTGTIMTNRLKEVKFSQDSKLKRGEHEEFCRTDENIVAVKWRDSKCVVMLSTYSGAEPVSSVKRWCKKENKYIEVPCPSVVKRYNASMGGVDICDQLVECYRTWVKTRKWTLKVVLHFLDLALVNAWMEYREDCRKCQVPKNKIMDLLSFRFAVADPLLSTPKRKRRSDEVNYEEEPQAKISATVSRMPSADKRLDGYDHWPVVDNLTSARCCRHQDCKSRTRTRCEKCNVYLCLNKDVNCF